VLSAFEDLLGVVLFAALVVLALGQVVVRFLLYEWLHTAWADEIIRALLVWTSFWGAVIVQREDDHIVIELLYDRLPRRVRGFLRTASDVAVAAFLLVLAWKAMPIFFDSFVRVTPATTLPTAIFDGPLWIACLLMVFHMAVNTSRRWRAAGDHRAG
jgi:C4-dicarboxylate transporter DctQ subunit